MTELERVILMWAKSIVRKTEAAGGKAKTLYLNYHPHETDQLVFADTRGHIKFLLVPSAAKVKVGDGSERPEVYRLHLQSEGMYGQQPLIGEFDNVAQASTALRGMGWFIYDLTSWTELTVENFCDRVRAAYDAATKDRPTDGTINLAWQDAGDPNDPS